MSPEHCRAENDYPVGGMRPAQPRSATPRSHENAGSLDRVRNPCNPATPSRSVGVECWSDGSERTPYSRTLNLGGRIVDMNTESVDLFRSAPYPCFRPSRHGDESHALSAMPSAQHVQLPSRPPLLPSIRRAQLHTARTPVPNTADQGMVPRFHTRASRSDLRTIARTMPELFHRAHAKCALRNPVRDESVRRSCRNR